MSTYHIDLEDSKEHGIVVVKLSGRAHAETIVDLLHELNALAERDPAVRVLIDESELGAGYVAPATSAESLRRGGRPSPSIRSGSPRLPRTRLSMASTGCFRASLSGPSG